MTSVHLTPQGVADLVDILDTMSDDDLRATREQFIAATGRAQDAGTRSVPGEAQRDPAYVAWIAFLWYTSAAQMERAFTE